MGLSSLRVDDQDYTLEFAGFEAPLRAALPDGRVMELSPWSLGQHFAALGASAELRGGDLSVDAKRYAAEVLGGQEPGDWLGLALWWAAGGGERRPPEARVRPWTFAERSRVLRACVSQEDGAFDLAAYLSGMMRACVEGDTDPVSLPVSLGLALQAQVNAVNAPEAELDDPAVAQVVLRLAAALGWTPARTLCTPASEVDQLLSLLDASHAPQAPARRAQAPRSAPAAFATDPSATIIHIDGD